MPVSQRVGADDILSKLIEFPKSPSAEQFLPTVPDKSGIANLFCIGVYMKFNIKFDTLPRSVTSPSKFWQHVKISMEN